MSLPVRRHRAITLIELTVVLLVIAVIASIAAVGVRRIFVNARNLRVLADIQALTLGLEDFNLQYGDYPPDFHDAKVTEAFLQQTFPACPRENYPNLSSQSPGTALYYWLAGPNGKGFSANPKNPFDNGPRRIGPFCKFSPLQLRKVNGTTEYLPLCNLTGAPYVYFRAGNNGYDRHTGFPPARPYRDSRDGSWINPDSYQILCAGQDGQYGKGCHYPGGDDYDAANRDDITNFSGGPLVQTTWTGQTKPTAKFSPTGGPRRKKPPPKQQQPSPPEPVPSTDPPEDRPRFQLIILPDRK
jgi:type II secretory pathway pseudopilin PulG